MAAVCDRLEQKRNLANFFQKTGCEYLFSTVAFGCGGVE